MASIISRSAAETAELGKCFAVGLDKGAVLALAGDLGSGKTHFVQGLAHGLGFSEQVTSPTFSLLHEYLGGRLPLYHFDCYRLNSSEELIDIGFEEYLGGDGVAAIEWADKFAELLPAEAQWIRFKISDGDEREIELP